MFKRKKQQKEKLPATYGEWLFQKIEECKQELDHATNNAEIQRAINMRIAYENAALALEEYQDKEN